MKNGALIECSTIEELHEEEAARIAGDEDLQTQITECKETCASEMSQLQANLDAEIDARLSADKALQALIETEASQRQAADIALQSNIDAEATTRAAADTALQGSIDTEATQRAAADSALQAAIDAEAAARQAADTSLQAAITSEATQRAAADSALQAAIEAYLQTEISGLQAQIDSLASNSGGYVIDSEGVYHVYTAAGIAAWRTALNSDMGTSCTLEADIDMADVSLSPIGSKSDPFTGVLDGNGHALSNMELSSTVNSTGESAYLGMFNAIGSSGQVKDLTLDGVSVKLSAYSTSSSDTVTVKYKETDSSSSYVTATTNALVGALAAYNAGTISGCSVAGSVSGSSSSKIPVTGGMVGYNAGTVTGCTCGCTVVGGYVNLVRYFTGGAVGYNTGVVQSTTFTGTASVSQTKIYYLGGVVGANFGTVSSCSSTGTPSTVSGHDGS